MTIFILILGLIALYIFVKSCWSMDERPLRINAAKHTIAESVPERFIVFDVETTGLDRENDEIVEIAAIKADITSDSQQTYEALVKINGKMPAEATKINGITDEMLQEKGIPLSAALEEFRRFAEGLPMVAYNADFDKAFVNNAAKRLGMKNIVKKTTCALKKARSAWPGLASYKLSELAKMSNVQTEGLHRALADCKVTLIVYVAAARIVKDKYSRRNVL